MVMGMRVAAVVPLFAMVLVGCADANGAGHPAPSRPSPNNGGESTAAAARMWASFPVAATPRPIVLLGDAIDGPMAFPDNASKLAFLEGRVRLATSLPSTPVARAGYPLLSAADAVRQLRAGGQVPTTTSPIYITGIALVDHAFLTDRGTRPLPAWRMQLRGVSGDVYVLAVAPSARYPHTAQPDEPTSPATSNGRSLTIGFVARHRSTGPCDPAYRSTLRVAQTRTAVVLAVTIRDEPLPPRAGPVACPALITEPTRRPERGAPRTVTVKLGQPLGNRVVVDGHGIPYVVTAR